MTSEQIAWHVNARRVALGREPVTMARVQRIVRWLRGPQPARSQREPVSRWDETRGNPLLYRRG